MNRSVKLIGLMLAISLYAASSSLAQWPSDPSANLMISDQNGSQTIPKVVATPDGGCYISWYSNASGNYDMYLQRLDGSGTPQWQQNGLLISSHTQETWLTDYDLTVDRQGNAIIAFNDIRAGGDWDIYGYRISPSGEFLWGADGLAISANNGFEPDPRVIVTSEGNIVFGWQEDNVLHLRKVNPASQDLWNPATKTLASQYPLSIPRITASDNDGFILQYLMQSGSQYWSPKYLYARKYGASGNSLWLTDSIAVSMAGGFGPQMRPAIVSDGFGGAYSYWYDSRNNQLHAFAQHINADGTMGWLTNGVRLSENSSELQGQPCLTTIPGISDVLVFFLTSDLNQFHDGLNGQRLDHDGNRLWGSDGAILVSLGDPSLSGIQAQQQSDGAIVTFNQSPNDVSNCLISAIRVDGNGSAIWPTSPAPMSSILSSKGYFETALNALGQIIEVWEDWRYDANGDIYLQNINPDGSLGGATGISGASITVPETFRLIQNYPNPFNAKTTIQYFLPKNSEVNLSIYDLLGRKVATVESGFQQAGYHQLSWDAEDFCSGIYFCRLTASGLAKTMRMQLLK